MDVSLKEILDSLALIAILIMYPICFEMGRRHEQIKNKQSKR